MCGHPLEADVTLSNPAPYTLNPTLYTLHPTPYTSHPTPYTPHPTPHTPHPTPYTLHPTPHTPQRNTGGCLWEWYHESRRCFKDTYPESHTSPSILVYEDKSNAWGAGDAERAESCQGRLRQREGPYPRPIPLCRGASKKERATKRERETERHREREIERQRESEKEREREIQIQRDSC